MRRVCHVHDNARKARQPPLAVRHASAPRQDVAHRPVRLDQAMFGGEQLPRRDRRIHFAAHSLAVIRMNRIQEGDERRALRRLLRIDRIEVGEPLVGIDPIIQHIPIPGPDDLSIAEGQLQPFLRGS